MAAFVGSDKRNAGMYAGEDLVKKAGRRTGCDCGKSECQFCNEKDHGF